MVEFPAEKLRARLLALTNNQEKIQTLSLWMMHHRRAYAVAVAVWQDVYRGAEDSLRQSLLYVANDLVQNCKQKNNTAYPLAFFACLPSCLALLTSATVKSRIARVLTIWADRHIYDANQLRELQNALGDSSQMASQHKPPPAPSSEPRRNIAPEHQAFYKILDSVRTNYEHTVKFAKADEEFDNTLLHPLMQGLNDNLNQDQVHQCLAHLGKSKGRLIAQIEDRKKLMASLRLLMSHEEEAVAQCESKLAAQEETIAKLQQSFSGLLS